MYYVNKGDDGCILTIKQARDGYSRGSGYVPYKLATEDALHLALALRDAVSEPNEKQY